MQVLDQLCEAPAYRCFLGSKAEGTDSGGGLNTIAVATVLRGTATRDRSPASQGRARAGSSFPPLRKPLPQRLRPQQPRVSALHTTEGGGERQRSSVTPRVSFAVASADSNADSAREPQLPLRERNPVSVDPSTDQQNGVRHLSLPMFCPSL